MVERGAGGPPDHTLASHEHVVQHSSSCLLRQSVEASGDTCTRSPEASCCLSAAPVTSDLPVPQQVRAGGHSLLSGTHACQASAVPLVRVVATVVLLVAGEGLLDAASCRGRRDEDAGERAKSAPPAGHGHSTHRWHTGSCRGSWRRLAGSLRTGNRAAPQPAPGRRSSLRTGTASGPSGCGTVVGAGRYSHTSSSQKGGGALAGLACFLAQGEQTDQGPNSLSRQSMGQLCWLQPLLSCPGHSWKQLLLQ